jgi:hypothetical protein
MTLLLDRSSDWEVFGGLPPHTLWEELLEIVVAWEKHKNHSHGQIPIALEALFSFFTYPLVQVTIMCRLFHPSRSYLLLHTRVKWYNISASFDSQHSQNSKKSTENKKTQKKKSPTCCLTNLNVIDPTPAMYIVQWWEVGILIIYCKWNTTSLYIHGM